MKRILFSTIILLGFFVFAPSLQAQKLKDRLNKAMGTQKKEGPDKGYYPVEHLQKIGGPFTDVGMTSEIHTKHVGKIMFSKEKIAKENADESKFSNSYSTSENIYGRVYMPKSVENYPTYSQQFLRSGDTSAPNHNKYGNFYYNLYIDGELDKYWHVDVVNLSKRNLVNTTTYQVWIHPKPSDQKVSDEWKERVQKLSAGEHSVKIDLIAGFPSSYIGAEVVASGEFKLIKKEGDSFTADYGKTFDAITSKMDDKKLQADMLEAARSYAKVNKYKEDFKEVKIANKDWTIIRHEVTGAVLRRIIDAHCLATWPDGHCSTQKFVFGQEYDGKNYSSVVRFHGVTYGSYAENLNCK